MSISAREARQRLFSLIERVNVDHDPIRISSRSGDVVLMSAEDYDAW
ncbi:type II toxin-antitoxin system Phd/YefM family antitoxin [Micromonospora sp. Llam0]|nr:type II toxin-antitoxin system prevent-host-death family antitoxin [Micromonospora sp. Llam0]